MYGLNSEIIVFLYKIGVKQLKLRRESELKGFFSSSQFSSDARHLDIKCVILCLTCERVQCVCFPIVHNREITQHDQSFLVLSIHWEWRLQKYSLTQTWKTCVSLGWFPVTLWLPSSCPLCRFGTGQPFLFLEGKGDRYNEWLLLCNISNSLECIRMGWKLFYPMS